MSAPFERVMSGQKRRPKAVTWNALLDAEAWVRDRRRDGGARPDDLPDARILARNEESLLIPQYALAWLPTPIYQDLRGAQRPTHPFVERLAIADEPVLAGAVGRFWPAGSGVHPLLIEDWAALTDDMCPFWAVSQTDSFYARRHLGSPGNVLVHARHATTGLAWAEVLG
jgi:hypothetical protein